VRPQRSKRQPTLWRQTRMLLDAVKHCLYRSMGRLGTCMKNWRAIVQKLAEPPRKRIPQMVHLHQALLEPG
jgi:hypothetical protein